MRARLTMAAGVLALVATAAQAGSPAGRMPVADGLYCGPENATIAINSRDGTVTIDGYTCGAPLFAADKLQSVQCRRADDPTALRREFDVRVLDHAFLYNGRWFTPCPG